MASALKEVFKQDICYRYYVEKKSKTKIALELDCARNTVRKYISECPESSFGVVEMAEKLEPEVHHKTLVCPMKTLQVSVNEAIEAGDTHLAQVGVVKMAEDQAKYLGITSPIDHLKIQVAFENYLQYRIFSRRVTALNGQTLDAHWLKSSEKMVKIVSKYTDAAQKHLRNFQDLIKELEIKYNKRSPDISGVRNLNIQNHEYNFKQESNEKVIEVHG